MGCVKSRGVTVDNLDFEGEKLWIRRQVFDRSPLDRGNGAGRTPSQHESRCGQRFISQSQHLDSWPARKEPRKRAYSIEQALNF
jgi:hypothetical protein